MFSLGLFGACPIFGRPYTTKNSAPVLAEQNGPNFQPRRKSLVPAEYL